MRNLNIEETDLLERVTAKAELQPIFFRKVTGLHWFEAFSEKGFFDCDKNPKPEKIQEKEYIRVPPWPVTEYLSKTSKELLNPENIEYAGKYVKIIREVTEYARKEEYSNYNTWLRFAEILRNIPGALLGTADIDAIRYWLKDPYDPGLIAGELGEELVPILIEHKDEEALEFLKKLLPVLYNIKFTTRNSALGEREEVELDYNSSFAIDFTRKIAFSLGEVLGIDGVNFFEEKIIKILNELKNDKWSSMWRPAIEDHKQNYNYNDTKNIILTGYRDCLEGFVNSNPDESLDYIEKILSNEFQTLQRVAIYIINKKYSKLSKLVDSILKEEYFSSNYRHEMWHLLNERFGNFRDEQQELVLDIISSIKIKDEEKSRQNRYTAYERSAWLKSIKEDSDIAAGYYKEYLSLIDIEPEHPDFSSYVSFDISNYESSVSLEDFASLKINEITATLKDKYIDGSNHSIIESLSYGLKKAVKSQPEKFYKNLNSFLECDVAFIHPLFIAFNELWNDQVILPWGEVWPALFNFIEDLIKTDAFWSDEYAFTRYGLIANRHWVVQSIGKLIEDGVKDDENSFSSKLQDKSLSILKLLLEKEEGVDFDRESDAVLNAINSPRGNCIEALINHSLRSCRLADRKIGNHEEAWRSYIDIYNAELSRKDGNQYEFATLVTMYIPNFLYMSSDWVKENLPQIFNKSDDLRWSCAMQGYSYVSDQYEILYKYLKEHGDLIEVLDDRYLIKRVKERIVEIITIPYLSGAETYEKSLLGTIIERKNLDEISHIIWFLGALKDQEIVDIQKKVLKIWSLLMDLIDLSKDEDKKIASALCNWVCFIDKINDRIEEWLIKIAPYAQEKYNAHIMLKELARISDKQPFRVQKIWFKVLDNYHFDYPEEALRRFFTNTVANGSEGERKAKEVADEYIKKGLERPHIWLKEIIKAKESMK